MEVKKNNKIQVFFSSVCGDRLIKAHQLKLKNFLLSRKIVFEEIDISQQTELIPAKIKETLKPFIKNFPVVFVDGELKGTFSDFEEACENEEVGNFFCLE